MVRRVPEVLVDNQKAVVLAHPRGGPVQLHPRCIDLAGYYGFLPRACRPARAQTKGKDERIVGYRCRASAMRPPTV